MSMILTSGGVFGTDPMEEMGTLNGTPARAQNFKNISVDVGLEGVRGDNLAWGDYNNDGYLDLLVRGPSTNRLFRNDGPPSWSFTEVTDDTGINTTRGYCQWADYDGDGYLDFYSAYIEDHLFRNNGPPNWDFTDVTDEAGYPSDDVQSEGITWCDYDRDGYPDIFTVGWRKPGDLQWPYAGEPDKLYHNNGDGTFSDVSLTAGLRPRSTSYAGMGVVCCDPNMDGWPDIYVCNYHINPNQLWINNRDGTFTDMAFEYNLTGKETDYEGTLYYGHCNGAGWADIDNDLDMDIFVSHLAHKDDERSGMNRGAFCADSQLFLNSGPPFLEFTDIREEAGIPITPSGTLIQDPDTGDYMWKDEDYFGVAWGDMDNDGDVDLWVPQVKTYSFWDHSFLWENDGDLTFTDSTDASNLKVWSNTGGTWVDFDNDGDLDFCTEGTYPFKGKRELHLFENPGTSGHWIEVDLRGAGGYGQSSTDANGAKVEIFSGDETFVRYVGGDCGGHGFQQPQRLHFGLGDITTIDEMWIYWPSGRIQKMEDVSVDQILEIEEPTTPLVDLTGPTNIEALEDESVDITVTSTGPNIDMHLWDHDADGYDLESVSNTLKVTTTEQGPRWIRYRAEDSNGYYWDLEPIILDIVNVAPKINAETSHVIYIDEAVFIDMNVSDTPSDIPTLRNFYMVSDIPDLWEQMTDGDVDNWPISFTEVGDYQIRLKTIDDDGAEDQVVVDVEVKNRIPEVTLQVDPIIDEDETVRLNAIAMDSFWEIDDLQYRFHSGDGRSSSWQSAHEYHFKYTNNGTFEAAVEVKDSYGDIGVARADIVVSNRLPMIEFISEESIIYVEEDEDIDLEIMIYDTANDIPDLETLWDLGEGETYLKWGTTTRVRHTYENQGTYHVNASVRDDNEAISTTNMTIVVENVPPEIALIGPAGNKVNEDQSFSLSGVISDTPSDRDGLEHRWEMGDGTVTDWMTGDPSFTHIYTSAGIYDVNLTVRDDDGTFMESIKIEVENIAPSADLRTVTKTIDKDSLIEFDASGSTDTSSDRDALYYIWDLGDGHIMNGSSKISWVYREGGTFSVEVAVFDDDGDSDTETLMVTVMDRPPIADLDGPSSSLSGEEVRFDASGSFDTETDIENLTFILDPGDGSEPIESNDPVIRHTYSIPGEFEVTLIVSDGNGEDEITIKITVNENSTVTRDEGDGNQMIIIVIIIIVLAVIILAAVVVVVMKKRSEEPAPPSRQPMRPLPPGGSPQARAPPQGRISTAPAGAALPPSGEKPAMPPPSTKPAMPPPPQSPL